MYKYYPIVVFIGKSKYCKGDGLFLVKACKKGAPLTAYPGLVWELVDKNLPKDNTYHVLIPNTGLLVDASTMIDELPPFGRGHKINECWNSDLANVRGKNHGKKIHQHKEIK